MNKPRKKPEFNKARAEALLEKYSGIRLRLTQIANSNSYSVSPVVALDVSLTVERSKLIREESIKTVGEKLSRLFAALIKKRSSPASSVAADEPSKMWPVFDVSFSGSSDCMCGMTCSIAAPTKEHAIDRALQLSKQPGWTLGPVSNAAAVQVPHLYSDREDWYGNIRH